MTQKSIFRFVPALTLAVALLLSSSPLQAVEPKVKLTSAQLTDLIAKAKTPAEHRKLAQYYRQESDKLAAESKDHEAMLAAYKKNPMTASDKYAPSTTRHCDYFVSSKREASEQMKQLAATHETMAKEATK